MAREVVLVNGLPGSGKTTLGDRLARELGVPCLSKDRVKEALADAVGHPAVDGPALGAAAMTAIWRLAASVPGRVVIDSWWFRPRDLDFARAGLAEAAAESSVEVWCDVPVELARKRYGGRSRHPVHRDDRDSLTAEWAAWAAHGAPLGLGPVIRVNTSVHVDAAALSRQVTRELAA